MKVDREDIDWGCLKLVVAKLKTDFGVSDDGRRLRWTDETVKSYIEERRSEVKTVSSTPVVSKQSSSSAASKENIFKNSNFPTSATSAKPSVAPAVSATSSSSSSSSSDQGVKRKRDLPEWMNNATMKSSSVNRDNSLRLIKRQKPSSIFK